MKKIIFGLLYTILPCIYSCDAPLKKLSANPKISYYIVGRLKTTEVDTSVPFEVKIFNLNPQLIEKPFSVMEITEKDFILSYNLNNETEKKVYHFGEQINDRNIHLLISKTSVLDSVASVYLKDILYQFQVKGE